MDTSIRSGQYALHPSQACEPHFLSSRAGLTQLMLNARKRGFMTSGTLSAFAPGGSGRPCTPQLAAAGACTAASCCCAAALSWPASRLRREGLAPLPSLRVLDQVTCVQGPAAGVLGSASSACDGVQLS